MSGTLDDLLANIQFGHAISPVNLAQLHEYCRSGVLSYTRLGEILGGAAREYAASLLEYVTVNIPDSSDVDHLVMMVRDGYLTNEQVQDAFAEIVARHEEVFLKAVRDRGRFCAGRHVMRPLAAAVTRGKASNRIFVRQIPTTLRVTGRR